MRKGYIMSHWTMYFHRNIWFKNGTEDIIGIIDMFKKTIVAKKTLTCQEDDLQDKTLKI